jgi:NIMA (never in mitosis gene a)-related kinase
MKAREALATPTPAELTNLFVNSPKVGLNFAKIFDFEEGVGRDYGGSDRGEDAGDGGEPSIPEHVQLETKSTLQQVPLHPVCAALPSVGPSNIRDYLLLPQIQPDCCLPTQHHDYPNSSSSAAATVSAAPKRSLTVEQLPSPTAEYYLSDEENLPSPFLVWADRGKPPQAGRPGHALWTKGPSKRLSSGNLLRVVAAVNAANTNINFTNSAGLVSAGKWSVKNNSMRLLVTSAKKAREEARKALLVFSWELSFCCLAFFISGI